MEIKVAPITEFEDEKARQYMKGVRYTAIKPPDKEFLSMYEGCSPGYYKGVYCAQDTIDDIPITVTFTEHKTGDCSIIYADIWYRLCDEKFDGTIRQYVVSEMKKRFGC